MDSPGLSSQPAKSEPIITAAAPPASALTISPLNFMPPSAITGMLFFPASPAQSIIALNCGTPIPAIILVVQIEPGPIPILTASAPLSIKYLQAEAVATLPAIV